MIIPFVSGYTMAAGRSVLPGWSPTAPHLPTWLMFLSLEEERGKGLSKWMMQEIDTHPDLQGLRRWMLGTRDAHGLYEQFGWTVMPEEQRARFMQRHFPEVYR
ncbi:MAG: GNAT family N-acetyltransferase [Chitinophagaceae bacterium]